MSQNAPTPAPPEGRPPPRPVRGDAEASWSDWAQDRILRGLIAGAGALPWGARLAMMGWTVSRVIAPLAGYRSRAMANLAHVWPEMDRAERRRIADAVADNAGRTMIENYDPQGLLARMARAKPHGAGLEAMERARAAGRPVLLVTGHFGNFEAPRAALIARGWQIGGLYRPMSNPYFNAHYAQNMHALGGPVFEQGRRGTMGLLKHIRQGGMGVLLFDIYDSAGVPIDFLGRPAPTLTSAAEIALKCDALLVPFFGTRLEDGQSFDVEFEAPVPHDTPEAMMRALTRRLEARVLARPEQWFWIHRRWKPKRQRRRAAARMAP